MKEGGQIKTSSTSGGYRESIMQPGYLKLHRNGELERRIAELHSILESCTLCPRACRKNRLADEKGYCQCSEELVISAIHPHFGEEEPLVGTGGSGTVFLGGCNLGCVYCQNYEISHLKHGAIVTPEYLAEGMMELQRIGCHNINFVTPTHFVPQLVRSLKTSIEMGLNIPIVYNCGGYESISTIRMLEGIVDIYMPDIKYSDPDHSERYSSAPDYFLRCREAVEEMHRQVGDLIVDEDGIAQRGLLIRHLILPNHIAGSRRVLKFIAGEISQESYVNIMFQYRPMFRASDYQKLDRRPSIEEFMETVQMARELGLRRGFEMT